MSALNAERGNAKTAIPVRREASAVRFSARSTWISPKIMLSGVGRPSVSMLASFSIQSICADLARDSDPTTHFAFVRQIRLTEFRGKISLLAQNNAVMKDNSKRDNKEQHDPVVEKKPISHLHTP